MQQRATGGIEPGSTAARTQPLYMGRLLYRLSHRVPQHFDSYVEQKNRHVSRYSVSLADFQPHILVALHYWARMRSLFIAMMTKSKNRQMIAFRECHGFIYLKTQQQRHLQCLFQRQLKLPTSFTLQLSAVKEVFGSFIDIKVNKILLNSKSISRVSKWKYLSCGKIQN